MPRDVFHLPDKDWFICFSEECGWGFSTESGPLWLRDLPNAMPLLPLLEMPWPVAHEYVTNAKSALGIDAGFPFEQVLTTALDWETQYWPSLAVDWLEQGFPPSADTLPRLQALPSKKFLPQKVRHRAAALARRLRPSEA
jgi:hypothetical protein